jgi:hypothetical protein
VTEPSAPAPPKRRSPRGKWTVVAMFVLGGAVLAGLFFAPRPKSPSAPPGIPVGVPEQPLKFAVYDLGVAGGSALGSDTIAREIASAVPAPDYVILLHAPLEDAAAIAAEFGMRASYDPRLCQRLRPPEGGNERIAACILSRHPLYDAQRLTARSAKEPYGIAAWTAVGGKKFLVACVWATPGGAKALAETWRALGAPPAVVGLLVHATAQSTPSELTNVGFSQGWGPPAVPASEVPGRWRPRLAYAGTWPPGAGASWDTNNTRVGVWSALGGGAAASRPATMPVTQPSSTRPGRL